MKSINSKFLVRSITNKTNSDVVTVTLHHVEDKPENRYFWQGESGDISEVAIKVEIVNPDAIAYFELGKEYNVTFTASEQP
jgi:hypothetical protein